MSNRPAIQLSDTSMDILTKMSEGNPGALAVLIAMVKAWPMDWLMVALHLDDMGIRGSGIWVAYKDHCGEDLEKFKSAVLSRSQEMLQVVNSNRGVPTTQVAVRSGASFIE